MVSSEEIRRKLEAKRKGQDTQKIADNVCSNCGAENPEGAKFCSNCGKELAAEEKDIEPEMESKNVCPNCGAENLEDSTFCVGCGSKLTEEAAEPSMLDKVEDEAAEQPVEAKNVCPNCGAENLEYSKFCVGCGGNLEGEPAEAFIPQATEFPDDIIIVSSNYVPGYKTVEICGFVYGLTVRSRGLGGQIGAGIRSVFGGEIKEYVTMMEHSRNEALDRMVQHAKQMGANAVISARFDSDEISNVMQEILAYGTAVIIEKE
ncbi:MAG: heavy metal-binding domain-containing protein [Euryarchaeota archaeon]|nr:heavy metal-binding domain-containing protein [Euryarchaeota archaeon]